MTEYDTKLKNLANFVPKLADIKDMLCLKFHEGLSLNVHVKMGTSGT